MPKETCKQGGTSATTRNRRTHTQKHQSLGRFSLTARPRHAISATSLVLCGPISLWPDFKCRDLGVPTKIKFGKTMSWTSKLTFVAHHSVMHSQQKRCPQGVAVELRLVSRHRGQRRAGFVPLPSSATLKITTAQRNFKHYLVLPLHQHYVFSTFTEFCGKKITGIWLGQDSNSRPLLLQSRCL